MQLEFVAAASGAAPMNSTCLWSSFEEPALQGVEIPMFAPVLPIVPVAPAPVMTDEQVEVLRRQISVYCMLCQQLAQMHKASIQEHVPLPGFALSHQLPFMPFDPGTHLGGSFHKVQARQRWTPSQSQLQILECLFKDGGRTPNKQRIKEITAELSQHGPIQETNVYNWFQNRKARAKRKTMVAGSGANEASDGETDGEESAEVKKPRLADVS